MRTLPKNCPKTFFTYFIIQSYYYRQHYCLLLIFILYSYSISHLFCISQLKELTVTHFTMIVPCMIIWDINLNLNLYLTLTSYSCNSHVWEDPTRWLFGVRVGEGCECGIVKPVVKHIQVISQLMALHSVGRCLL